VGEETPELPWTKLYGGKVVENITQAVARIVVAEQMAKIGRRYPVALQVHDEVVCVVPEDQADACKQYMTRVMSTPPKWAPDLPVACEADIGPNYGSAK
jgi:DNA polymerase